jgi:hypothetical protein
MSLLRGADMFVFRVPNANAKGVGADRDLLYSRPCHDCTLFLEKLMKKWGLRKVYYTTDMDVPFAYGDGKGRMADAAEEVFEDRRIHDHRVRSSVAASRRETMRAAPRGRDRRREIRLVVRDESRLLESRLAALETVSRAERRPGVDEMEAELAAAAAAAAAAELAALAAARAAAAAAAATAAAVAAAAAREHAGRVQPRATRPLPPPVVAASPAVAELVAATPARVVPPAALRIRGRAVLRGRTARRERRGSSPPSSSPPEPPSRVPAARRASNRRGRRARTAPSPSSSSPLPSASAGAGPSTSPRWEEVLLGSRAPSAGPEEAEGQPEGAARAAGDERDFGSWKGVVGKDDDEEEGAACAFKRVARLVAPGAAREGGVREGRGCLLRQRGPSRRRRRVALRKWGSSSPT